ncbi:hypothetical protein BJI47_22795 [Rhodococcus sp. 1168]|nr:hypothetical protein BJI47_22795 [Rhodococcus sp. 1168]
MSETVSKLSDLLNSQPVTARQAAEIADKRGVPLPYGTIAAYWSGRHGRPSAQTLERLAEVLTIPIEQLQKAAWNKTAPVETWNPPAEVRLLNERQRRALDELIRSFAATQGAFDEDTSTQGPPSNPPTDGKVGPRGASNTRAANGGAPDNPDALIEADQGSQADHALAARKGETEDEKRERLGIAYE